MFFLTYITVSSNDINNSAGLYSFNLNGWVIENGKMVVKGSEIGFIIAILKHLC